MSIDLIVQNPLGASVQPVQDQNGNQSPLALGSNNVKIGTGSVNPNLPLTVSGNPGTAPLMEVASQSNEAAIRYINNDNLGWHVGSGAGVKNFFFWNPEGGVVLSLTSDGTLNIGTAHARNLQVSELPETTNETGLQSLMINPATGQIFRLQILP